MGNVVVVVVVVVVVLVDVVVVVVDVVVVETVVVESVVSVEVVIGLVDVEVVDVVVLPPQGQRSATGWPTTFFRHRNASVGLIVPERSASQMHDGSQS